MTHPDDDALAAIALGEPAPSGAAEHVRSCPACSDALAALRDTMAALRAPAPALVAPPASVWEAVEAELDREPRHRPRPRPSPRTRVPPGRPPRTAPAAGIRRGGR